MKISEDTIKEFEKAFQSCVDELRKGKFKRKQADAWMEGWIQAKGIWEDFGVAANSYRFIQIVDRFFK